MLFELGGITEPSRMRMRCVIIKAGLLIFEIFEIYLLFYFLTFKNEYLCVINIYIYINEIKLFFVDTLEYFYNSCYEKL